MGNIKNFDFYGLKVSDMSFSEIEDHFDEAIAKYKPLVAYGYSFTIIPYFKKYRRLYFEINSFDISVTDGMQFYWYTKMMGFNIRNFISIPDLTNFSINYANDHKLAVMLLGGTAEINLAAQNKLKSKYENISICGLDGYFDTSNEEEIVKEINKKEPHILLVGISSPKKEDFVFKNRDKLNAKIIIPCGGMIDIFAGKTKLTPKIFKKLGLASFYRVIQEPKRLLLLNIWLFYEIVFKIIPISFYQIKIKKNKSYFIPSIYGLPKK